MRIERENEIASVTGERKNKVIGVVDGCDVNGIYGWVVYEDKLSDSPDEPIEVNVFIDGELITRTVANIFRQDLLDAQIGGGECVFNVRIPNRFFDRKEHSVEVRDVVNGLLLKNSPKSFLLSPAENRQLNMGILNIQAVHEVNQFILISQEDSAQVAAIGESIPFAVLHDEDNQPKVQLQERRLTPEEIFLACIGGVALSAQGKRQLETTCRALYASFGIEPPEIIDLTTVSKQEARERLLLALVGQLITARREQARRNVALMRETAQLRQFHAKTQDAFARLEQYVYDLGLNHRSSARTVLPVVGAAPFQLQPGTVLEQRLPRGSAGLSDVAISLSAGRRANAIQGGTLTVDLSTVEDNKIHAVWHIPASQMKPGWLRLTLPTSLESDDMTPVIRLAWESNGYLHLDRSMRHPDERFQATVDGHPLGYVLALRTWSYVPGCEAPIPHDGHLPSNQTVFRRVLLSPDTLATAINLQSENEYFRFIPGESVLMVHVMAEGIATAVLPNVARVGTVSVSSSIYSRSEKSPEIEYAIALAPVEQRPKPDTELPDFSPNFFSDWSIMSALVEGELHVVLPTPVREPHDIYLMTRLPEGQNDISYGWSSFFNINLIAESGDTPHG